VKLMLSSLLTTAFVMAAACPNAVPEFRLSDSKGAVWTADSLTKKPSVLVFLKHGCPMSAKAAPVLNSLQRQLGESAQVIGVMNASPAEAQAAAKELKLTIPVLGDQGRTLIKGFGAARGLQFSVVATKEEARWAKLWDGLGRAQIEDAFGLITKHGHALAPVNLQELPENALSGCLFPAAEGEKA